jgi:uncharacterized protein
MPFGRRDKKSLYKKFKSFIKYIYSFSRTKKYIKLRLKRIKGSPRDLSAGLATGLAISFTPFIGLHTLLSILIAWLIGASMASAIIGTLFGNPWTFPFIWYLTYELGQFLYQGLGSNYEAFSFGNIKTEVYTLLNIIKNLIIFANMQEIKLNLAKLNLIPIMVLGAIPFVCISWFLSYVLFLKILKSYKKRIIIGK